MSLPYWTAIIVPCLWSITTWQYGMSQGRCVSLLSVISEKWLCRSFYLQVHSFKTISLTLLIDSWNGKWDLEIIGLSLFLFFFIERKKTKQGKGLLQSEKFFRWSLPLRGHGGLVSGNPGSGARLRSSPAVPLISYLIISQFLTCCVFNSLMGKMSMLIVPASEGGWLRPSELKHVKLYSLVQSKHWFTIWYSYYY